MRTSILAILFFFSLAPMALAGDCGIGMSSNSAGDCVPTNGTVSGVNSGGGSTVGGVNTGSPGVTLINPLKSGTSLESFLGSILDFIIRIGSIVIVLMVVFVGYKFVVAQGAPAKIEEAKKMLLWTLVGALVLLGAKAISLGILATVKSLGG